MPLVPNTSTDRDVFVHGCYALAIQAAVVYAVPPGLTTKYGNERDVGHDGSFTVSTVEAVPTVRIHYRDLGSGTTGTTVGHRIPLMPPPLDQSCATITVTHTTTKTAPPKASTNSTSTTTITHTKTTTILFKGNATEPLNIAKTNNASLNSTLFPSALPKNPTAATDGKCGAKVGQTCILNAGGKCWSMYEFCGETDALCGAGCQGDYGVCGAEWVATIPE
ncbi:hypothetical protein V495_00581 [Pseudogymnoascus sp. VKM F-4514 (FW-929)]|nr:hypothetical protein V495_00581 [Pseudogymnoascus sp. VKM F-4514 (FW-929)]KFY66192.1 hypothetical protein V497_01034 [Pseudogymnoascus sp. VKM F-4516 (FW-969)]